MRYIEPKLIHAMKRDFMEPEQVGYKVPTHFRIRYIDQRWRRIYAKRLGTGYITMDGHELLIDQATMHKLMELQPEPMTEEEQERSRPIEERPIIRYETPDYQDDDIPF